MNSKQEELEKAYELGFAASGEGWNGEYPGDCQDTLMWISSRDRDLRGIEMSPPSITDEMVERAARAVFSTRQDESYFENAKLDNDYLYLNALHAAKAALEAALEQPKDTLTTPSK